MASVSDNRVPPLVRLANLAGAAMGPLGLAPTHPQAAEVIEAVTRQHGGTGDVDDAYLPAFESALRSAGEGTRLTPFGCWGVREVATRMLSNRLGIAATLREHPEIGALPIERPVFVVGWFRSGTTLLHRLLASAQGARIPHAWELYFPVPGAGPRERDARRRLRQMRNMLRIAHTAIPSLADMHRIEAESAEEATVLLDNEGAGVYFLHAFGAHGHGHFLAEHDLGYAYRSMRRQLQLLSWSGAAGRWVLKCPFSMWKLDALFEAFPDAQVVHIHRDPRQTVGSVCSLSAILQQSFCAEVDLRAIGRFWSDFYLDGLQRARAYRQAHPDAAIVDVAYDELVGDTEALLTRLSVQLDLALDVQALARDRGDHGRSGGHSYDLSAFGLEAGALLERFGPQLPIRADRG